MKTQALDPVKPDRMIVDTDALRAYKKQFNFFETPDVLADKMALLLDSVGFGARILEPSAGLGSLIRALRRNIRYEIAPVEFCEVQDEFVPILEQLGATRVGSDFLRLPPAARYNGVIMNPPYKNKMAEAHLDHAWHHTAPGGFIAALVSKQAAEWVDEEFCAYILERELIKKGFAETSITTVLFLINKPLYY